MTGDISLKIDDVEILGDDPAPMETSRELLMKEYQQAKKDLRKISVCLKGNMSNNKKLKKL